MCLDEEMGEIQYKKLNCTLESSRTKEAYTPKRSRGQEIGKLRAEINQLEAKRMIQRISRTKSCFFQKINKLDKAFDKPNKGYRDSIQINKIINVKGDNRN